MEHRPRFSADQVLERSSMVVSLSQPALDIVLNAEGNLTVRQIQVEYKNIKKKVCTILHGLDGFERVFGLSPTEFTIEITNRFIKKCYIWRDTYYFEARIEVSDIDEIVKDVLNERCVCSNCDVFSLVSSPHECDCSDVEYGW